MFCHEAMGGADSTLFDPGHVLSIATSPYTDSICAVYEDGSLHCLGSNTNGELGTGNFMPVTTPTMVAPPGSVRVGCL